MTDHVELIDVSPRDGLQNEAILLDTSTKVELITRLVGAGVTRLEATSFVHPRLVPAMADAEAVMQAVPRDSASYIGLVLNERGLERAIAARCDEINYVVPATDTFSTRNQGTTTDEALAEWRRIAPRARDAGLGASVVVSVAFGCPFEGEVEPSRVTDVVRRICDDVPDRLFLADTIGVASPRDVVERFRLLEAVVPPDVTLGAHFHNTRNTALANAYAAVEVGVRSFDASLGGIGGCPFAPKATGNVPTEDLAYMFDRMGLDHGLDLDALASIAIWMESHLPDSIVGLYSKAGPFPTPTR